MQMIDTQPYDSPVKGSHFVDEKLAQIALFENALKHQSVDVLPPVSRTSKNFERLIEHVQNLNFK